MKERASMWKYDGGDGVGRMPSVCASRKKTWPWLICRSLPGTLLLWSLIYMHHMCLLHFAMWSMRSIWGYVSAGNIVSGRTGNVPFRMWMLFFNAAWNIHWENSDVCTVSLLLLLLTTTQQRYKRWCFMLSEQRHMKLYHAIINEKIPDEEIGHNILGTSYFVMHL